MSNVSVYWLSSNVISLILNVCTYLNHITSRKLLKNETAKRKPKQNKLTLLVIGDLQLLLRKQKPQLCRWWKHDDASKWQKSKVYKENSPLCSFWNPLICWERCRRQMVTGGHISLVQFPSNIIPSPRTSWAGRGFFIFYRTSNKFLSHQII